MIIDLTYKRTVNAIGRNGLIKQAGISVIQHDGKNVSLTPVNSKGVIANGMMEIPIEDVPSVIAALQKVLATK